MAAALAAMAMSMGMLANCGGDASSDGEGVEAGEDSAAKTDGTVAQDSASSDTSTSQDSAASDTGSGTDAATSDASDGGTDASDAADAHDANDASDAHDATDATDASADAADAADAGPSCTDGGTGDLSNVGSGDFVIQFTITTSATVLSAVLNQRAVCNHGVFWDIRLNANGTLGIETDDGSRYTAFSSSASVNDGSPHAVVVRRIAGTLSVTVDGAPSGSQGSTSSWGSLAALKNGTDVCVGFDTTVALSGSVTNVCVTPL